MERVKGGRATASPNIIDRESDQPIYAQLADLLHNQILNGKYSPGEKMPSEAMIVKEFSVSPMTVRRAINLLAARDIITTSQGKGTFVKAVSLINTAFYLRDIESLFDSDAVANIKIIDAHFVKADEKISDKLHIPLGKKVIFIRRLVVSEDVPIFYHREFLISDPRLPVVEAELQVTELQGIFQGVGNQLIKSGDISLSATTLNQEEILLLQLHSSSAGMMLEHIFYDFDDQPLSWGWFICDSRYLRFHTRIGLESFEPKRDERTR